LKIDAALNELGAERFFSAGSGDAGKDMDYNFNEWCTYFWVHTLSHYGIAAPSTKSIVPTATLPAEESNSSATAV
jgi:cytochrome P450/NADPH-cytochrome P450 reductase